MIIRVHLAPALGTKRLDAIVNEEVQRLKHRLLDKAPKTVNNILTVLNVLLKTAVEWNVIERVPCTIRLLPVTKGSTKFYDFDEFERLVAAANMSDSRAYIVVLLAGEAGLRLGEMSRSNGTTWISSRDSYACSGPRGKGRSPRRKEVGCDMCL